MKKTPNITPENPNIAELQAMVKLLMSEKNEWKQESQSLFEQLKLAFDLQFARRSESLKPYNASQGALFNEMEYEAAKEEVESTITTTTTKKRGKRKTLPKTLPREVIELDIDAHDKQCACCHHTQHKIDEDCSEKLEFTPAVLKLLEYMRYKHACSQCEKIQDNCRIIQKLAPQSIIPKSFATKNLLANIILGKCQYTMPLYRQESRFTQSGINLSGTTMARWVLQVSEKLTPLYAALKEHLLRQVVVQADETPLNVIKEEKQCYMWLCYSGADSPDATLPNIKNIVLYDYQNSLARACPVAFLGDYRGYLQTDGYSAYDDGLHQMTNVGCFAHVCRKFMDAKKLPGKADNSMSKIQKLNGIESRLIGTSAEQRKAERQKYAKPILDELYEWMTTQWVIASSALGKAIKCTLNQWSILIRYIEDGHLSIDNNRAESAMFYSIVETAKANGLILYDYLVKYMEELAKPEPDIDDLLNFKY